MDPITHQNVISAYEPSKAVWELWQVVDVFDMYFSAYIINFGKPHPRLKVDQIKRIIKAMPTINGVRIEPIWYADLIDLHFKTDYGKCDYNINHFFSGRIRELRFHEVYG